MELSDSGEKMSSLFAKRLDQLVDMGFKERDAARSLKKNKVCIFFACLDFFVFGQIVSI